MARATGTRFGPVEELSESELTSDLPLQDDDEEDDLDEDEDDGGEDEDEEEDDDWRGWSD